MKMSFKQRLLKFVYPALMAFQKRKAILLENHTRQLPSQSFYQLSVTLNNGATFSFDQLKGKQVLLVNTATGCGFTPQFESLQQLQQQFSDELVVLGFPSNDFKQQEPLSNHEIQAFCQLHYNTGFLMSKKITVRGNQANHVYQWLSQAAKNGWNNQPPAWNFSKYLVNASGVLTHYFDAAIDPLSTEVLSAIKSN